MRHAKLQIFRDAGGQWRWRLRAPNGRIVACSGEGYRRRRSAARAARRVQLYLQDARI